MGRKREVIPMIRTALCLTIGCALGPVIVAAEVSEQYVPKNFQRAYANGTRSPDGRPGPGYWQNRADYELEIELEPKSRWITGRGTITYFNNSPDELLELVFHLFPNLYAAGAARDYEVRPDDLTSGMVIQALAIAGAEVDTSPDSEAVELEGTTLTVVLHEPLPSQGSLEVSVSWKSRINRDSHLRDGAVDASSLFSAYFFPRIAVNDDIDGWNRTQYTGTTEFYNDFGDFKVDITIPEYMSYIDASQTCLILNLKMKNTAADADNAELYDGAFNDGPCRDGGRRRTRIWREGPVAGRSRTPR